MFGFFKQTMEEGEVVHQANQGQKRKKKRGASNDDLGPEPSLAGLEPTEEEIRQRAYEINLGRSGAPCDPVADWLQAERGLREERNRQNVSINSKAAGGGRGKGKGKGAGRGRGRGRSV